MFEKALACAKGLIPATLAVKNGLLVNVNSGEIYPGGVACYEDTIVAIGNIDDYIGEGTEIIDACGHYITPGFIDGHIHPESSSMNIRNFAAMVQSHGTSVIMTDIHEFAVVCDLYGMRCVLEEAKATTLKIYHIVPSHVPVSSQFETSACHFSPEKIQYGLEHEGTAGISEVIGTSLAAGNEELLKTIEIAKSMNKSVQGHLAGVSGKDLNMCLTAGVTTDHEALFAEQALERLRNGCFLMLREGSVSHNLRDCLRPILDLGLDTTNCCIVTDDLDTLDGMELGHLDNSIRIALEEGLDFMKAIQMVTVNAARAFRLEHEVGSLAPGRRADINITSGPEDFKVMTSIAGGKTFMRDGEILMHYEPAQHDSVLLNTMHMKKEVTAADLEIRTTSDVDEVPVIAMYTEGLTLVTSRKDAVLPVIDHVVQADPNQDVLLIAQVERHGKNGNIGKAFMSGFNLKSGAIASSVGHDNHNIIVMGTNYEDMALAVNEVARMQGGQVVVDKGQVIAALPLPVAGLVSDLPLEELAKVKRELNKAIEERGGTNPLPFMVLSFVCLAAIPQYAVTDHGFIDVFADAVISPVVE